jgi:hypothetical protein
MAEFLSARVKEGIVVVSLRFPRHPTPSCAVAVTVAAAVTVGLAAAPGLADQVRAHEWWLTEVHVTQAWQVTRGAGVTVAVLDTGVDPVQADLSRSVITGPDYTHSGRHLGDIYWGVRGTAMAALIAGHGHGPGHADGIIGIAPKAKVLSVRVSLEPTDPLNANAATASGLPAAIAAGIRYAVHHGAKVIDLPLDPGAASAGGVPGAAAAAGGSSAERKAVAYALGKGVVLVAPAGDDGPGHGQVNYPAAYPGVISAGAFAKGFVKARFSSRRSYVTLTAPGQGVITATSAGYTTVSSTSAASAEVAGMAALILARYPGLTPAQVGQVLTQGARFRRPAGHNNGSGFGTADAAGALNAAAQIEAAGQQASHPPAAASASPVAQPAGTPLRRAVLVRDSVIGVCALLLLCLLAVTVVVKRRRRRAGGVPPPTRPFSARIIAPGEGVHDDDAQPWSPVQGRQRPQLAPVPKLEPGKRSKQEGPPWEPAPKPASEPPWGTPDLIGNRNGAARGLSHPAGGLNGRSDAIWRASPGAPEPPVHRDPASDPLAGLPATPGSGIFRVPPALAAGALPPGPAPTPGRFDADFGAPPPQAPPAPGAFDTGPGAPPPPAPGAFDTDPGTPSATPSAPEAAPIGPGRTGPRENGRPAGDAAGLDPDGSLPQPTGGSGGAADHEQRSGPVYVWNPAATTEDFPAVAGLGRKDSDNGGHWPAPPAPGGGYPGAAMPGADTQAFPVVFPAAQQHSYPADEGLGFGEDDHGYPDDDGTGYPEDDEDDRHL